VRSRGFRAPRDRPFDADGERRVSRTGRVWFRNGGCARRIRFTKKIVINRKFTSNQINRVFAKFLAI
jgi:hypothetical protein